MSTTAMKQASQAAATAAAHSVQAVGWGRRVGQTGFTLIELMVAVAIIAILARFAFANYQTQMQKSRRSDAKTALLDLASREERYFSTNNTYTSIATLYGGSATSVSVGSPSDYTITVTTTAASPTANPPTQAGFVAQATVVASSGQATDSCGTYQLDNFGQQLNIAYGASTTASVSGCW